MSQSHSILVNIVISSLIILGGIGFTVIVDIKENATLRTLHYTLNLCSHLLLL